MCQPGRSIEEAHSSRPAVPRPPTAFAADAGSVTEASQSGDTLDVMRLYLGEIGRAPLLTAEQEVELAQRVEAGDRQALEHLATANLRLVVSVAKRYVNQGLPLGDLVQEGALGLLRAIERFDWRRGHRFTTYATWWVRQAITRALNNQSRTIRLPARLIATMRQVNRARREMTQQLGREPAVAELASALGLRHRVVVLAQQVAQAPLSLDAPLTDDSGDDLGALYHDIADPGPEEQVIERMQQAELTEALSALPPREYEVLRLRFGLDGRPPCTLAEVGARLGLGRERVRQIERGALGTLRRRLAGGERRSSGPILGPVDGGPPRAMVAC